MVFCFNATSEAKSALDALMQTGQFRDVSEAISVALVNYQVIQKAVAKGETVSVETGSSPSMQTIITPPTSKPAQGADQGVTRDDIPVMFRLGDRKLAGLSFVPTPEVAKDSSSSLSPALWLFGQYNKLLPVKATCRALLNLLRENPNGVPVTEAVSRISDAAGKLGDHLQALDRRHQFSREDSLSVAFPTSDTDNGQSRLRFGNQFVAQARPNQLGGLPAALRLIATSAGKVPRITLTQAGAEFAMHSNPVLDDTDGAVPRKLSESETDFLLAHIRRSVPEEFCAYATIIDAIAKGSDTPDEIDAALRQKFSLPRETDIAKTFLSTQRTGAISRMVDLGLVAREKTGLRVTYLVTQAGRRFQGAMT